MSKPVQVVPEEEQVVLFNAEGKPVVVNNLGRDRLVQIVKELGEQQAKLLADFQGISNRYLSLLGVAGLMLQKLGGRFELTPAQLATLRPPFPPITTRKSEFTGGIVYELGELTPEENAEKTQSSILLPQNAGGPLPPRPR